MTLGVDYICWANSVVRPIPMIWRPAKQPNTTMLTQADIVRRLVPSALLKRGDLDPDMLACIGPRDLCRGWEG